MIKLEQEYTKQNSRHGPLSFAVISLGVISVFVFDFTNRLFFLSQNMEAVLLYFGPILCTSFTPCFLPLISDSDFCIRETAGPPR